MVIFLLSPNNVLRLQKNVISSRIKLRTQMSMIVFNKKFSSSNECCIKRVQPIKNKDRNNGQRVPAFPKNSDKKYFEEVSTTYKKTFNIKKLISDIKVIF